MGSLEVNLHGPSDRMKCASAKLIGRPSLIPIVTLTIFSGSRPHSHTHLSTRKKQISTNNSSKIRTYKHISVLGFSYQQRRMFNYKIAKHKIGL